MRWSGGGPLFGVASRPSPGGAQEGSTSYGVFVGIDVSLDSVSICIVDERGVAIKEGKCPSEPEDIGRFIRQRDDASSTSGLRLVACRSGSMLG